MASSLLDVSSHIHGASIPPPSMKSGPGANSANASNKSVSDHDDEWKNIHVVSSINKYLIVIFIIVIIIILRYD